jgi:hypothetical protein
MMLMVSFDDCPLPKELYCCRYPVLVVVLVVVVVVVSIGLSKPSGGCLPQDAQTW